MIDHPPIPTLFPSTTLFRSPAVLEKLLGAERNPANARLAFRLSETEKVALIPACIDQQTNTFRNRGAVVDLRSEEHTSELQSRFDLVCRFLLENKNNIESLY